ncbi:MAG: biotin carboxylase N-terminal domain-containing protein [Leucobacter sp.]
MSGETGGTPTMLSRILIANRGEIAVRIIRAARDANLATVAVYADPDFDAPHVELADEAYALRGSSPVDTYLNIEKLLDIAARSGADAVHPGYGFLSENAEFARAVLQAGLTWIGPRPETIELLGDKGRARALAADAGAPLAPGAAVSSAADVTEFAESHGFPVVVKAVHGGGGRGMRVVRGREEIVEAFDSAVREATAAFGGGACLVEQFLERPRHIEVQVLGDSQGNMVVLGTRDCTLQRRHQKLVEEAPAPFLSTEIRERVEQAATAVCQAARYVGAGTVEFLLAADETLSFLEVNTRLQVEHTVTEEVTGVDIVQQQFRIAAGHPVGLPERVEESGHAIEFRITAEDPALGFLPTPGKITRFDLPGGPGVRVDSGVRVGQVIPGDFDSLLAKLVIHGQNREQVLARARRALTELVVEGIATSIPFHRAVLEEVDFASAAFAVHTGWVEEHGFDLAAAPAVPEPAELRSPSAGIIRHQIEVDGKNVELGFPEALLSKFSCSGHANGVAAHSDAGADSRQEHGEPVTDDGAMLAPFAGTLSSWKVSDGNKVEEGQTVATIEAMKMEVPIRAPRAGVLSREAAEGASLVDRERVGSIRVN